MKRKYADLAILPIVCGVLSACTSQQLYGVGLNYQRNQCLQMPDKSESDRCLSKLNTSYDEYKREVDAGRK